MPSNANVIIEYGPYNSQGIIEYKIERLQGLQSELNFILNPNTPLID
jgi:hypothetical protein